jgi:heptosyltransferase-2
MSRGPAARALIIRLSSVGDVVLATPVAERLGVARPGLTVDWLVDEGYQAILASHPAVGRVIAYDYLGRHRGPAGARRLVQEIGPVDLVVDLQHKLRSSLVTAGLRPRERHVLVKRRGLELVRALVGRDTILQGPHQVERYLAVLPEGAPPEGARPRVVAAAGRVLEARAWRRAFAGGRPAVGLVVGARHATKRWPTGHWAALVARCLAAGLGVALLGSPEEVAQAAACLRVNEPGPLDAQGGGELATLMARLAVMDAVVSPDSGPAHLAAALGRPVVALFGPTSPARWAPRGSRVRVLRLPLACSPCSNHGSGACPLGTHECLRALGPDEVFVALSELLAGGLEPREES